MFIVEFYLTLSIKENIKEAEKAKRKASIDHELILIYVKKQYTNNDLFKKVQYSIRSYSEIKYFIQFFLILYFAKFFRYYEATIDAISEDGIVNITFNEYKNTDVTMLSQLKSVAKRPASDWADQKSK